MGPEGLSKRYFAATLIIALWCAIGFLLDGIFDFWILIIPLTCLPVIGLVIYFMSILAANLAKRSDQHSLAVLFGPTVAAMVVVLIASITFGLGFTPGYIFFLRRRSELFSKAAMLPTNEAAVVGILRMSGFFTGCSFANVVVRDPTHRIGLPFMQRDDAWRTYVLYIVENVRCGGNSPSLSVRHLEGDFYAVRLD